MSNRNWFIFFAILELLAVVLFGLMAIADMVGATIEDIAHTRVIVLAILMHLYKRAAWEDYIDEQEEAA